MTDPYQVLGVAKSASAEEIKSAYRKLAKKLHPDLNPGNKAVEQQFKEVSQAYSILGNAEQRARFDRGEIDASGQEKPSGFGGGFYRRHAESGRGSKYRPFEAGEDVKVEDIFAEFFGQGGRQRVKRGADILYKIGVPFLEAAQGAKKRVQLGDGKTLDIRIPAGTESGQQLRLKGQGAPGANGAPAGDALVEVEVEPHPFFVRDGRDIRIELPVTLAEAVLGASVTVPTIGGSVAMKIPPGSSSGKTLRLKGKGIAGKGGARGDQYVTLKVTLPDTPDKELEDFVRRWSKAQQDNPRRKAGMEQ
ncbi:MAG: DnaJ C-terminal domain-containing protein [Kiloniellales bacterium]